MDTSSRFRLAGRLVRRLIGPLARLLKEELTCDGMPSGPGPSKICRNSIMPPHGCVATLAGVAGSLKRS